MKTKICAFVDGGVAKAIRMQAARLGLRKSEVMALFALNPYAAQEAQENANRGMAHLNKSSINDWLSPPSIESARKAMAIAVASI